MEYVDTLNSVSLGTVVAWILSILFVGGLFFKGLEKYRKIKNGMEKRDKAVVLHEKQIGEINKDVSEINKKVDDIIAALNDVRTDADEREARRLRREILKFSDGIRDGKVFSQDAFQDIIESNEEYEKIITKREIKNGFIEHEMCFIESKYDELYGGVHHEQV